MSVLLIQIVVLSAAAVIGAAAGWWIRGAGLSRPVVVQLPAPAQPVAPQPASAAAGPVEKDVRPDQVNDMMAQLHRLTATVAADVGEHNSEVARINQELTSGNGQNVLELVQRLAAANDRMQSQLESAEKRLQDQASEMQAHIREARTDALTKLANRRAFDDEIRRCVATFKERGAPACVIMFDVDHFKKFNDTYGHQAGDAVLQGVARTLRGQVKGNEVVCRYGGEEFAIIFPGHDLAQAMPTAEKARAAVAKQVFEFEGLDLKVTASGGLAQLQAGETGEALVKRADEALYRCKEAGRNCGHYHDGANILPMTVKTGDRVAESRPAPAAPAPTTSRPVPVAPAAPPPAPAASSISLRSFKQPPPRDRVGLPDDRAFVENLARRIAEWRRGGATLCVEVIAVDDYQATCEASGGKVAQLMSRAVAQLLKASMRDMDYVSRLSEHEFVVLLPGAELAEVSSVAERLRLAITNCQIPTVEGDVTFTVSIGAAQVIESDNPESLVARALDSLDDARRSGGNRTVSQDANGQFISMALGA